MGSRVGTSVSRGLDRSDGSGVGRSMGSVGRSVLVEWGGRGGRGGRDSRRGGAG